MSYAVGRKAIGICVRCGFQYLLKQLCPQVEDMKETGMLVCETCLDKDQPQLQLGRLRIGGPRALNNPRPDTGVDASRFLESYEFVGGLQGWSANDVGSSTLTKLTDSDLALFYSGTTFHEIDNLPSIYKGSNLGLSANYRLTGDPSINLDSSKYSTISMNVARTSAGSGGSTWLGECVVLDSSGGSVNALTSEPSDPSIYNLLTWDMSNPISGSWSGIFTSVNFVFWTYSDLPSAGYQLSIDYIKFS